MDEDSLAMTDLSDALRGPDGAGIADRLRDRLTSLHLETKQRLANGIPYEQFERYQDVSRALASARAVIVRLSPLVAREARGVDEIS